ncbi:unnamed protein product [Lupinus luteus]|uniref:Ndc10 domain-containing protein n=1 Tax=Lupinus luteus TaxID=3873 RepID=A0AAV1WTZ0_LUPLU
MRTKQVTKATSIYVKVKLCAIMHEPKSRVIGQQQGICTRVAMFIYYYAMDLKMPEQPLWKDFQKRENDWARGVDNALPFHMYRGSFW